MTIYLRECAALLLIKANQQTTLMAKSSNRGSEKRGRDVKEERKRGNVLGK
jgi:hypothetical protein